MGGAKATHDREYDRSAVLPFSRTDQMDPRAEVTTTHTSPLFPCTAKNIDHSTDAPACDTDPDSPPHALQSRSLNWLAQINCQTRQETDHVDLR